MPRIIEVSTSAEKVDSLVKGLRSLDRVIGIARQRDGSVDPRGDTLSINTTSEGCRAVLRLLDRADLSDDDSITTSEPRSVISSKHRQGLDAEGSETIWEEMAFMLCRNTNPEPDYLTLMALAGAVAAVGLWTETLYIVVATGVGQDDHE